MSDEPAPTPFRPARADWRQGAHDPSAVSGRGALRATVLIALLAAAGGLVGLYFWIAPPNPARLVTVPVFEYTDPAWPANACAEFDSALLRASFPGGTENAFNFQEHERLAALLESLKATSDRPVVLHLSALAVVRGNEVYLLPGHAKPDDPTTWLKLTDALTAFAAGAAKYKLLLLDLAHPVADPYRGPLADDVAGRVHDLFTKNPPSYFVLCPCGPGEFSLPLGDKQASAFAYYIAQGMAGPADRYNARRETDGRVSVRELAAFVTARVSRWAEQNRGVRQTPVLYPASGNLADFPLTFEPHAAPEAADPPAAYSPWLLDQWKRRDDRRAAGAFRLAPAPFEQLQETLLRAERAWEEGLGDRTESRYAVRLAPLQAQLDAARLGTPLPLRSLVAARAGRPAPPAELAKALEKFLAVRAAVPPAKPEELQMARAAFVEPAKANKLDAAGLVWDRIAGELEPAQAKLRDLAALLREVQPFPSEEELLLRRLAAWESRSINWPTAAVAAILRTEDTAGRALGLLPDGFPWVRNRLAAADKARRDGEAKLLGDGGAEQPAATSPAEVQQAVDRLAQAETAFTEVLRQLEAVRDARRTAADAAVVLTGTTPAVIAGDVPEQLWRDAATHARTLADLLTRPADRPAPSPAELKDPAGTLHALLRSLEGRYSPAEMKKALTAAAGGGPAEYRSLRALLRSPLLKAPERKAVWEAARPLSHKLREETLRSDEADDEAPRLTPAPLPAAADDAEPGRAARRARVSVDLLRLLGVEGADRLAADRLSAGATATDWSELAAELRTAWVSRRPVQYQAQVAKRQWAAAGRLSRGPALEGVSLGGEPGAPPAVRLWQDEESACRSWLREHYRDYGRLRSGVSGATDFYEEAAADCR